MPNAPRQVANAEGGAPSDKPKHKATYARDKRKGGYLIRVAGPYPDRFAGREVPVTRRDGSGSMETLDALIWSGIDDESGDKVALYSFVAKPRDDDAPEALPF